MRKVRQRYRPSGAFTLLEVMVAVTILGVAMAAIYTTWSTGLNGWKHTAGISGDLQRERIVMAALADLTKSIIFSPNKDHVYSVIFTRDVQMGDSISFVTSSDTLLPLLEGTIAGLRRVTTGLQRDGRNRPFLAISNMPALDPVEAAAPVTHVLSADVCGLAVRFRDPRNGVWMDEWYDDNLVPSAIEYTVGFGANDGRTPPVVVTRSVELPVAPYALLLTGMAVPTTDTTNTVTRRDIELMPGGRDSGLDSE